MSDSRSESTVTFRHPIVLKDYEVPQAAGTYRLVFDQEEIRGSSFTAMRRTAICLQLPALSVSREGTSLVRFSQDELDALLASDVAQG